jgi:predicted deacylase
MLPSGDLLSVRQYFFKGAVGGAPSAYIQAGVHGTEVQGTAVCAQLLEQLAGFPREVIRGDLSIIANANPHGLNSKFGEHTIGPFDAGTGLNWNRAYLDLREEARSAHPAELKAQLRERLAEKSGEILARPSSMQRHAMTLQRLAQGADVVLDLHTSARGSRYVYGPGYALEWMALLNAEDFLLLSGRFSGSLDEAISCPFLAQEQFFPPELRSHMPFGLTVELGGQEFVSAREALEDARGILALLAARGCLDLPLPRMERSFHCAPEGQLRAVPAPCGGLFEYHLAPGAWVSKGESLGAMLRLDGPLPRWEPLFSPFSGRILVQFPSAIVSEGIELCKILCDPERRSISYTS